MDKSHEKVTAMLKSHLLKKRRIEQLRYELSNPPAVSETELLSSLSVGGAPLDAVPASGQISDRTMLIAMRYGDTARRMNHEAKAQIARELRELEIEAERLEHYISLLDARQADVLRRYYFDGKPWNELEEEMSLTTRALINIRNSGVNALVSMYEYIEDVKNPKTGG